MLDPRLARLPGNSAKPIELYVGLLGTKPGQHLDVLDRDEELVVAGVDNAQAVMRRTAHLEGDQPVIAANTVLGVDNEIAGTEGRNLGDELVEILPPLRRARKTVTENVLSLVT